jgi:hypothetical protein
MKAQSSPPSVRKKSAVVRRVGGGALSKRSTRVDAFGGGQVSPTDALAVRRRVKIGGVK